MGQGTGTEKTLDDLNEVLRQFAEKVDEVRAQPENIESAFERLEMAASVSEGSVFGIPGAIVGGVYNAVTSKDLFHLYSGRKEEIKAGITKLLEELSTAIQAMRAPIAFLETSQDWLTLKADISDAQSNGVTRGELTGYWQGAAFFKYNTAKSIQDTAYESAKGICDTVRKGMVSISDSAWTYYTDVVKQLVDFLGSFAAALGKIATVVTAPWGISDAIDCIKKVANMAASFFQTLTTALRKQFEVIGDVISATASPKGFVGNKWPRSASTDYNIDAPDKSEWEAR